jgi:hypothetical protein
MPLAHARGFRDTTTDKPRMTNAQPAAAALVHINESLCRNAISEANRTMPITIGQTRRALLVRDGGAVFMRARSANVQVKLAGHQKLLSRTCSAVMTKVAGDRTQLFGLCALSNTRMLAPSSATARAAKHCSHRLAHR